MPPSQVQGTIREVGEIGGLKCRDSWRMMGMGEGDNRLGNSRNQVHMTSSTVAEATPHSDGAHLPSWSFLTNYAIVLVYVALHPDSTVRTIAADVGVTERAALSILRDLDIEGIVRRTRNGRRNTYSVDFSRLASMRRGGRETTNPLMVSPVDEFFKIQPPSACLVTLSSLGRTLLANAAAKWSQMKCAGGGPWPRTERFSGTNSICQRSRST